MLAHAGAADESLAIAMVFAALWVGWIGWSRMRGTGFGRLPTAAGPGLLVLAVVTLGASAIVPGMVFGPTPTSPAEPTETPAGPRIASTATLAFAQPTQAEAIAGKELRVVLDLQDGTVIDATTTDIRPDEGHIHLSVDGALVSMTYGTVQVVGIEELDPGEHTLDAEFVAADHLPFDPPVIASVTFTKEST